MNRYDDKTREKERVKGIGNQVNCMNHSKDVAVCFPFLTQIMQTRAMKGK